MNKQNYEKFLNKNLDEKLNILYIQNQILRLEMHIIIFIIVLIGLCVMPKIDSIFIIIPDIVVKILLFICVYETEKDIKILKKLTEEED